MLSEVKKGDPIQVKILDINVEKERISLGLKQLKDDPIEAFIKANPIRTLVTGKISAIDDRGISVILSDNINGYIKKINLSKDKQNLNHLGHQLLPLLIRTRELLPLPPSYEKR